MGAPQYSGGSARLWLTQRSDLGALASRPDARWRKGPDVISRLVGLQAALLDRAGGLVEPGGTLVYSTCTIS